MNFLNPSAYFRWCLIAVAILLQTVAVAAATDEEWLPVKYIELEVEAGSALDFSSLVEAGPAGRHGTPVVLNDGHIGFEQLKQPQRFFCASMAFSGASGGVPDRTDAERLALQLKRTGYNAIRLHNIDIWLMSGRDIDFDFNREQLDRFHYFLSRLKANGIYWFIDAVDSDNGAFGAVYPHRWIKKFDLRIDLYTSAEGKEHWARIVDGILGSRNPYTGSTTLQDPALLGLILVNEGGIAELSYRNGQRYSPKFEPAFTAWLKARYGNDAALRQAWSGDMAGNESLQGTIKVPKSTQTGNSRERDFMRFATDLERETLHWMRDKVQSAGYKGLVTAFNNFLFHQPTLSRSAADFVDMHTYQSLPTNFDQKGSQLPQTSGTDNAARYVRELTNTRQWGKPFTVSEYGQPFWNSLRHQSVAMVPAYAALQGWDLITNFAESSVQLDYRKSPYGRRNAIYPFGVGTDPILRSGERLAALLFMRADVKSSPSQIHVHLDSEAIFQESAGWGYLTENVSRLGLIAGIGLNINQTPAAALTGKTYLIERGSSTSGLKGTLSSAITRLGLGGQGSDRLDEIRRVGIVPAGNKTDLDKQIYQSDTGELLLDTPKKQFTINTARTDVVTTVDGQASSGSLSVSKLNGPALVSVSSLDGAALESSKRILLIVLSDAINSDMKFADPARATLVELGHLPVLLKRTTADLRIRSKLAGVPLVYALTLSGQRRDQLQPVKTTDGFDLHIDTGSLSTGPTTFFEITWDKPADK